MMIELKGSHGNRAHMKSIWVLINYKDLNWENNPPLNKIYCGFRDKQMEAFPRYEWSEKMAELFDWC